VNAKRTRVGLLVLAVTLMVFAAAPTVSAAVEVTATIDPVAQVDPTTGIATVTGTLNCSAGAFFDAGMSFGTLSQIFAHRVIISNGFGMPEVTCTGAPEPWSATVLPGNGLFLPGAAHASVSGRVVSPDFSEEASFSIEADIRLRASH
jgi:hypothetical protein